MAEKRDYYEILGVDRNATEKEIKSAYRRLAMKYHPDRSDAPDAEERFKEISEAYAVLSDPEKRRQYDQFGHAGIGQYTQEDLFRSVDFEDLLRGFGFGGADSIFDIFFGRGRRGPARGRDLRYDLDITLEQAASGIETTIEVPRTEVCRTCGGTGAKPGTSPVVCSSCHGTGQITRSQVTPFGQIVTSTTCTKCGGRGEVIQTPCDDCDGSGRVRRYRKINVRIPPGVDSGHHIKLRGQGEAPPFSPGTPAEPGDLYIFINVRPHPLFFRDGDDLIHEINIGMTQAALGAELEVPTLDGKARLKIPPGTQSGTIFRIKGKGMPKLHASGTGDLLVRANVKIPTSLTPRQRELLEELARDLGESAGLKKQHGKTGFFEKIVDEVKGAVR